MSPELEKRVRERLDEIGDPCSVAHGTPMGLDAMGLIEDLEIDDDGKMVVHLRLTSPSCMMVGYFDVEIRRRALAIDGIQSVEVKSDRGLDWHPSMIREDAQRRRRAALARRGIPV